MEPIVVVVIVLAVALFFGLAIIRNVIYICPPNKAFLFSGGRHVLSDGQTVGYRIIQGGRGIRVPLFEAFNEIDLSNMIIDVAISNAYSRGGISLTVHAVANVKVASKQPRLHNAVERFLGKSRAEIMTVARETLEGNLRGVLAKLTPEEVNEDRERFQRTLLEEVDHDLARLGLELDTLTIQSVSDEVGYLASIGRQRNALLLRDAKVAEARAQAQAAIREAKNREERMTAQLEADRQIAKAQAERQISAAKTRGTALVAESKSEIVAQKAKAEADLRVQEQRLEQIRRRLTADVLAPAEATMKSMQANAIGKSASIIEEGKANAQALRDLANTWRASGPHAREIFLSHKLNVLLDTIMSTVSELKIDKLTIIDSKLGAIDASGSLPMKAASAVTQIRETLGVDLAEVAQQLTRSLPGTDSAR